MACDRPVCLLPFRQIVHEAARAPAGLGEFPFDDGCGRYAGAESLADAADHRGRRRVNEAVPQVLVCVRGHDLLPLPSRSALRPVHCSQRFTATSANTGPFSMARHRRPSFSAAMIWVQRRVLHDVRQPGLVEGLHEAPGILDSELALHRPDPEIHERRVASQLAPKLGDVRLDLPDEPKGAISKYTVDLLHSGLRRVPCRCLSRPLPPSTCMGCKRSVVRVHSPRLGSNPCAVRAALSLDRRITRPAGNRDVPEFFYNPLNDARSLAVRPLPGPRRSRPWRRSAPLTCRRRS